MSILFLTNRTLILLKVEMYSDQIFLAKKGSQSSIEVGGFLGKIHFKGLAQPFSLFLPSPHLFLSYHCLE